MAAGPDRSVPRRRDGVGLRARAARRRPLLHLAALWIQPPDEAAREIAVVDEVVRVVGDPAGPGALRQGVFRDLVRGEPVGPGLECLERKLLDRARLRVEPAQIVRQLSRVPERSIRSDLRVVRPRARRRHIPFPDDDLPLGSRQPDRPKDKSQKSRNRFLQDGTLGGALRLAARRASKRPGRARLAQHEVLHRDGVLVLPGRVSDASLTSTFISTSSQSRTFSPSNGGPAAPNSFGAMPSRTRADSKAR